MYGKTNRRWSILNDLISLKSPKSQAAEAYRTLRTNIQFSSLDDKVTTILVTSAKPNDGKTTIVSNLAITTAQSGNTVLLLDCDLRKPAVHKKFKLSNEVGLTTILSGEMELDKCIKTVGVTNFYILTAGPIPPNPAEVLGSNKMKNLIKELSKSFDKIFIDAPPVLPVTDAQILASLCDGVLLATSYGETAKNDVIRTKELIDKVGTKIIGLIINKVPDEAKKYKGYYQYE